MSEERPAFTELPVVVMASLTASARGVPLNDAGVTVMPAGAARNTGAMVGSTTWEAVTPEGRVALVRLAAVIR